MLFYQTKKDVTSKAKSLGSKAKSFAGAIQFLRTKKPFVTNIATRATIWNRGVGELTAYFNDLATEKEERYLNSQGKMSSRQIKVRNTKRDKNITSRAQRYLVDNWPYRQTESRWAGGKHSVYITISKKPSINCESEKAWSSNGKWSGTNSNAYIFATRRTFKHFPTLTTPDGLIVIDAKLITPREYKIIWIEQSRGVQLKTVSGWFIRGYHVKAKNIEVARKKAAKARSKALSAAIELRIKKQEIKRNHHHIWVSLQDSFDAGNCVPTSKKVEADLKRIYGNIGGIRADVLLNYRDDFYTRRAVTVAARRY